MLKSVEHLLLNSSFNIKQRYHRTHHLAESVVNSELAKCIGYCSKKIQ
jgi:hypothetical protein